MLDEMTLRNAPKFVIILDSKTNVVIFVFALFIFPNECPVIDQGIHQR